MSSQPTTAILRPGHAERVSAGHPWIYERSIQRFTREPADGEVVQVKDSRKRFVGIGFHNSKCRVRIRMAAAERVPVDQAYFEERIRAAMAFREKHLSPRDCYRVVNAEGDFLGGLVVDKYCDILAVQISSLAFNQRRKELLNALNACLPGHRIIEIHDAGYRRFEGLPETPETSEKSVSPGRAEISINGLHFSLDLNAGHKTGAYLDQQANYLEVGAITNRLQEPRVLDCFSYQGGFSLHAAKHGAIEVLGLEQNAEAVELARANATRNHLDDQVRFEQANVFDWFKSSPKEGFDMIILDPPSFTRSRANLPNAARGYKEIHLRALRLLKPGGILTTFSCSHHASREFFLEVICESAFDARRQLRLIANHAQPIDHPTLPAVPETDYLKGFSFVVT